MTECPLVFLCFLFFPLQNYTNCIRHRVVVSDVIDCFAQLTVRAPPLIDLALLEYDVYFVVSLLVAVLFMRCMVFIIFFSLRSPVVASR